MKNIHTILYITLFTLIVSLSGCYEELEFNDEIIEYNKYSRIVGPKGGIVKFYNNYSNDKIQSVVVELNIPAGALDSNVVFNMYEYQDYDLAIQMQEGYANFGSKFLYFVPFYKSEGYNEQGLMDPEARLSIKFKKPVKVAYYYLANEVEINVNNLQSAELYYNFYKSSNKSYSLYQIKIPEIDEWGQGNNVYIEWTQQGYPNGYNKLDLNYIISGKWRDEGSYGTENASLVNWEVVSDYEFDVAAYKVSFEITSTDYMFTLAKLTWINPVFLPFNIKRYITDTYPNSTVVKASFSAENGYELYLTNGYKLFFNTDKSFEKLEREITNMQDLPSEISVYLLKNYPTYKTRYVKLEQFTQDSGQYIIKLDKGTKLYFNLQGILSGQYIFDYGLTNLTPKILSHLNQEYKNIPVVNLIYNGNYLVYLNDGTKVTYNVSSNWVETENPSINLNSLEKNTQTVIQSNYNSNLMSSISHYYNASGVNNYTLNFINGSKEVILPDGTITYSEQYYLDFSELSQEVSDYINQNYPTSVIAEINYFYDKSVQTEYYEIDFLNEVNLLITTNGTIIELTGKVFGQLPLTVKTYINVNLPDMNNDLYEYDYYSSDDIYDIYFTNEVEIEMYANGKIATFWGGSKPTYNEIPLPIKTNLIANSIVANLKSIIYYDSLWTLEFANDLIVTYNYQMNLTSFSDNTITLSQLPATIQDYLNLNFAAKTISEYNGFLSTSSGQFVYEVILENRIYIYFDQNKTFYSYDYSTVSVNDLPVNIQLDLRTRYPSALLTGFSKYYSSFYGGYIYEVALNNNISLIYNNSYLFITENKKKSASIKNTFTHEKISYISTANTTKFKHKRTGIKRTNRTRIDH